MDINYELYKVFFYVAQSLSFSEASKHLYISQSAVSQSIKTLERKLGQPLFIRSTKKSAAHTGRAAAVKTCGTGDELIRRGENQLFDSQGSDWSAAHRRKRHHLPLFSRSVFPEIPSAVSKCADQGHERNLFELRGSAGTGKGGSDHHQCTEYPAKPVLHPENCL